MSVYDYYYKVSFTVAPIASAEIRLALCEILYREREKTKGKEIFCSKESSVYIVSEAK